MSKNDDSCSLDGIPAEVLQSSLEIIFLVDSIKGPMLDLAKFPGLIYLH